MDAYQEYYEAAKRTMRAGTTAHDVHMAVVEAASSTAASRSATSPATRSG